MGGLDFNGVDAIVKKKDGVSLSDWLNADLPPRVRAAAHQEGPEARPSLAMPLTFDGACDFGISIAGAARVTHHEWPGMT